MRKHKILIRTLLCVFLCQTVSFANAQSDSLTMEISSKDSLLVEDKTQIDSFIYVVGVGDMMLGTNYPSKRYLPPNDDCAPLLAPVKDVLISADIAFGNCEGSFHDNAPLTKHCSDPSKCYAFRMPEKYAQCLKDAGFDMVSLANNHVRDFGQKGMKKTVELLDTLGIKHAGLATHPWDTLHRNGVVYGLCAFSPNTGTCKINNYPEAIATVKFLDSLCDVVIVSFHGGAEGPNHQHVTRKTERFYGENRGNVYEFAHTMIDAGADVIFGHGPHVTRAMEIYKERYIIYSMGNFCTYHRFNLTGPNGMAPIIKLKLKKDGTFVDGKILPIRQRGEGGPVPDAEALVVKKIKSLCESDFPEYKNKLIIEDDGNFYFKQ